MHIISVKGFKVSNNIFKVPVHEVNNVLNRSPDVDFDNFNDDIVEDRCEYSDHRVHQPVGQNVAG